MLGASLPKGLAPDFPQSEIAATNIYDSGGTSEVWAENSAKNWAKFSAHIRASLAVQNDPQIFSPNSSQFSTPCLVAEILKFHLRELLGFGGRNKGPFRTKNSTALESVVFCYRRSFVLSVHRFPASFS